MPEAPSDYIVDLTSVEGRRMGIALRVGKQLAVEMVGPLVFATVWTIASWRGTPNMTLAAVANVFGVAFVGAAYLLNQFFRIYKHVRTEQTQEQIGAGVQRVRASLEAIELRGARLIGDLEVRTKEIIDTITGGDSYCYLMFDQHGDEIRASAVVHQGKFRLLELTIHIIDSDRVAGRVSGMDLSSVDPVERLINGTREIQIGSLAPEMAHPILWVTSVGEITYRTITARFFARNGQWVQQVRWHKGLAGWVMATQVLRSSDGKVLHEAVHPQFPRDNGGNVIWRPSDASSR